MPATDIYTSTPLLKNEKSIRLLTLEPSRRLSDALVSTLHVASIAYLTEDLLPSYHALSYVWGDYCSPKDTIRCGTVEIPITRNCRDALRAVRSLYKTSVTIWVDAICINQADVSEKEQQIKIMSDIYIWAYVVDFWLGQGSYDSWQAMKWLEKAAETNYLPLERIRAYRDPTLPQSITYPREAFKITLREVSRYYYSVNPHEFERCMDALLQREWFQRAWTFQEAILSSHSRLICGDKYIDWHTMVQGMAVLRFKSRHDAPKPSSRGETAIYYPQLRHQSRRSISQTLERTLRLPNRLRMFDRFVQIWMQLKRPQLRVNSSEYALDPTVEHSAHSTQNALINYLQINALQERLRSRAYKLTVFLRILAVSTAWCAIFLLAWHSIHLLGDGGNNISIIATSTFLTLWCSFLSRAIFLMQTNTDICLDSDKLTEFRDFLYPEDADPDDANDVLVEGIVNSLRQRKAKRPHDKSYAMYGVLQTMGLQLATIDYSKSVGQTYHELMVDLLRWSPTALIILLDAGNYLHGAPSWVPNWSQIPPDPTISADYFLSSCHRSMDATPDTMPSIALSENQRVLITQGYKRDIITFSTPRLPQLCYSSLLNQHVGTRLLFNEAVDVFACWIHASRLTSRSKSLLPSRLSVWSEQVEEVFPNIMLEARSRGDDSTRKGVRLRVTTNTLPRDETLDAVNIFLVLTRSSIMPEGDAAFLNLKSVISCFPNLISSPLSSQELKSTTTLLLSDKQTLITFIDIINELALNYRQLFTTHSGYFGCGSYDVKKGDDIALIAGIPAPMILRQKSPQSDDSATKLGQYQVICAAFVLGMMDGSAWEEGRKETLELV